MLTGRKRYILADIASVQDSATGDRIKQVTKAKARIGVIELVGVNTAQLAQIQGFNLSYSVEIPRVFIKTKSICILRKGFLRSRVSERQKCR